jgi:hypothetical protein
MRENGNGRLDEEDEEGDEDEEDNSTLDEESVPLNYLQNKQKYQPVHSFSTTSLYASTPMKSTESYNQLMSQERNLFLVWFFAFVLISPLVFRYAMGSNLIHTKTKEILLPLTNATLHAETTWDECLPCHNYYGVTLRNVSISITNVTSPDPDAKTPSIAVFASQDMEHW